MEIEDRKPKILMIGATHGDEPIGVRTLCDLAGRTDGFDWTIGNPPAFRLGSREFQGNLNRSAPGDARSSQYAERRAAEILASAENYDWCIDLHGTSAYTGIFVIITNLTRDNLRLAARLDISRIVYWPSISPELKGPLSERFPCGLEIECGPKSMPLVEARLTDILERFVRDKTETMDDEETLRILGGRELYEVDGVLKGPIEGLEDFVTIADGTDRVPLLVGQYADQGITCYMMHRVRPAKWW